MKYIGWPPTCSLFFRVASFCSLKWRLTYTRMIQAPPIQVFRICFTSSLLWRGISCHPVKWCMCFLCAPTMPLLGFPGGASGEEPACQRRRPKRHGFNPWVGKIPWRRDGSPLQYSCLENPMDRGAWWVRRIAQSQTQLKWLSTLTQCLFQLFIL